MTPKSSHRSACRKWKYASPNLVLATAKKSHWICQSCEPRPSTSSKDSTSSMPFALEIPRQSFVLVLQAMLLSILLLITLWTFWIACPKVVLAKTIPWWISTLMNPLRLTSSSSFVVRNYHFLWSSGLQFGYDFEGANAFPDTCTCEDDSSIIPREILNEATSSTRNFRKARKQLKRAFKNCRPKSCTCPNGDIETVTFMGCSEGGFPKCDSSRGKPQCTDGRKIKPLKAILAQINRKCVCDDGLAPKCKNGGQMLCPNGQTPDWSLAQLPQLFSQCSFDSRENWANSAWRNSQKWENWPIFKTNKHLNLQRPGQNQLWNQIKNWYAQSYLEIEFSRAFVFDRE